MRSTTTPESLILPGFVDLQVNGAFGVDVASESARLPELSEALLSTGTTSYLPTVISSPEGLYEEALPEIGDSHRVQAPRCSASTSKGPFINLQKRGAHAAAHVLMPDAELLAHLLDLGPVRMITLAPELEGADELMALAANRGVVVSAGHSDIAFEVGLRRSGWAGRRRHAPLQRDERDAPPRARAAWGPPSPTRGPSAA